MAYGLLPTGYRSKPFEVTRSELVTAIRSDRGQSTLSEGGWIGTMIDVVSAAITKMYDIGQAIYSSLDRQKATGDRLEALVELTGVYKLGAAKSSVTVTLTGDNGTAIPALTEVRTVSTGVSFVVDPVTLVDLPLWSASTVTDGQRLSSAGHSYQVYAGGVSSLAPTATDSVVFDAGDGVLWYYLGDGTAAADTLALSADYGPYVAGTQDIRVIQTPVVGLKGVLNIAAANVGRLRESDESVRIAQQRQLGRSGSGTERKILADAFAAGCTAAEVFENLSDEIDANGQPPHSVQLLVQGSTDEIVANNLLAQMPVGIPTYGNITTILTDSKGKEHTIKHSRPVPVPIYVAVDLSYKDASVAEKGYPANGDELVKLAVVSYAGGDGINQSGLDVAADAISAGIRGAYGTSVQGVFRVISCLIGTGPGDILYAQLPISPFEIATLDVANISVTSSPAASV